MKHSPQIIELGLKYDSLPVQAACTPLGTTRMGPAAFLRYLEMISDCETNNYSNSEQIARCIGLLTEHPEYCRAYKASFKNTPIATAQEILHRINYLYMNGWDGTLTSEGKKYNESIVAIDAALGDIATTGKRLLRLAKKDGLSFPFITIKLVEQKKYWPVAWQRVFSFLQVVDAPQECESLPEFAPTVKKQVISFDSSVAASEYMASITPEKESDTYVIAEHADSLLRESLQAYGKAACTTLSDGYDETMEIIAASLMVRFGVPSSSNIFSFLSLPHCPLDEGKAEGPLLSKMLRCHLSDVGGFEKESAHWCDDCYADKLKKWLPVSFYDYTSIVPCTTVSRKMIHEALSDIESYLLSLTKNPYEKEMYTNTISACSKAFDLLGDAYETISFDFFRMFVDSFTNNGREDIRDAQAGSSVVYTSVGQLQNIKSIRNLIWYLPQPYVPSKHFFFADDKLYNLSFPDDSRCAFSQTCSLLSKVTDSITLITVRKAEERSYAEMLLTGAERVEGEILLLSGTQATENQISYKPLATPKEQWNLGTAVHINKSDGTARVFSPTQLEMFLEHPQRWVLERKAGIKHTNDYASKNFEAQRGTVAHAVVELAIKEFGMNFFSLNYDDYTMWFKSKIETLLFSKLYVLENPERKTEKLNYINTVRNSVWLLFKMLKENGATAIYSEVNESGKIGENLFGGRIDILFDTAEGKRIVDMKYSSSSNYKMKLETGTDIQLACYEYITGMSGAQNGVIDPRFKCGYWLFPKKKLFTSEPTVFSGPSVKKCKTPNRTHAEIIEDIADAITEYVDRFDSGDIPVISDKAKDQLVVQTDNQLLADICKTATDLYDDEKHLYGFSEEE